MLPADLGLRDLGVNDVDEIVQLVGRCDLTYLEWAHEGWTPPDLTWYADRWYQRLPAMGTWARGAFDPQGRLVGIAAFRPERDATRLVPGVAHINAMFVHPDRWRQGIGGELLDLAEREMRSRKYLWARLWTPEGAPARAFYETRDYRPEGRREFFEELGMIVVGYEKPLSRPA